MKKLWTLQIPIVLVATAVFLVLEVGNEAAIFSNSLFKLHRTLQTYEGFFTDWKFKLRGNTPLKNKVVIVAIDAASIDAVGRWPWHRDVIGTLIDQIAKFHPLAIGLDAVFNEKDERISADLIPALRQAGIEPTKLETDFAFARSIHRNQDHLVLGWEQQGDCFPAFESLERCLVKSPAHRARSEEDSADPLHFAIETVAPREFLQPTRSPLFSSIDAVENRSIFNQNAKWSGFFDVKLDQDGVIRRMNQVILVDGVAYPSLPLRMASVGLGKPLALKLKPDGRIDSLSLDGGTEVPVSPIGNLEINFRGDRSEFPFVSAVELLTLQDDGKLRVLQNHSSQNSVDPGTLLENAYVLIGASAQGLGDMRNFATDSSAPGVIGHATIVDNLLSGDSLKTTTPLALCFILIAMTLGALLVSYLAEQLAAVPAISTFVFAFLSFLVFDVKIAFAKFNLNLNTGPLYLEMGAVFVFTLALRYMSEERNRRLVRDAFSHYVAPEVVNHILRSSDQLKFGGVRQELTILFSDIRGFTSITEKLSPSDLSEFLREYLTLISQAIIDTGGTIDKYIGDAVMAFWGAPVEQRDHASRALRSARRIQEIVHAERTRFQDRYGIYLSTGIGVHTGEVTVGNMGSDTIFNYTVIGDSVNLASRVEGLTKIYKVGALMTPATSKSASDHLGSRIVDRVRVRGRDEPVELIEIFTQAKNPDGIRHFEEGRAHYEAGRWGEAMEALTAANRLLTEPPRTFDGPCQVLLDRSRNFLSNPPLAWDGVWNFKEED